MEATDYNNPKFEKRKQIINRIEQLLENYNENKKYKKTQRLRKTDNKTEKI